MGHSSAIVRIGAAVLAALLFSPASHAADRSTPDNTVAALWRAMSHEAGVAADAAALRDIFHNDAVVFGSRLRNGQPSIKRTAIADFLDSFDTVSETAFHECEIARRTDAFDRFAAVYSIVESRTDAASVEPDFTGVNSIQLYRDDDGWKIVSLYYHVGSTDLAIPGAERRSGRCLD